MPSVFQLHTSPLHHGGDSPSPPPVLCADRSRSLGIDSWSSSWGLALITWIIHDLYKCIITAHLGFKSTHTVSCTSAATNPYERSITGWCQITSWSDPSHLIAGSCFQHIAPMWEDVQSGSMKLCARAQAWVRLGGHTCQDGLRMYTLFFFFKFALPLQLMHRNTQKHTHRHTSWGRGACPVSSESALRGLTWAATWFSGAGSDQTEGRPPPARAHLFFSLWFLPSPPPHICTSTPGANTHWHTHTHTDTLLHVPLANHMQEERDKTSSGASHMGADGTLWFDIVSWLTAAFAPPPSTHSLISSVNLPCFLSHVSNL